METIRGLMDLGFAESEAKIYLALLAQHPASGYQIGKSAGLPRSLVYDALARLEARGAVLRSEAENAAVYKPLDPEVLLRRHIEAQERTANALRPALAAASTAGPDDRIWSFSRRQDALSCAADLIERAKSELYLVLTDPDLDALRGQVEASARRIGAQRIGILLTGTGSLSVGRTARHPAAETAHHRMEETLVVVRDEEELLISSGFGPVSASLTRNPNLVLISRQFVWMELFSRRLEASIDPAELARLRKEA